MRRYRALLTALTLGTPLAGTGAQDITVRDFGVAQVTYTSSQTPKIRRGMTSRVTIVKHLLNHVPFELVSASGGATIGNLSNGHASNGTGFIAMDVTVPAAQATGSTITLNVGLIDKYNFTVVRRGLVTSITGNPQPTTIAAGTPWVATVQGTDLGTPVSTLGAAQCHTSTAGAASNTTVQFNVTRQASCAVTSFVLGLTPSAANDPPNYRLANGAIPTLSFSYLPAGVACTSNPNVGAPIISQPSNSQVIVFTSGTPSPASVLIRWDSLTQGSNQPAPNNEWVVARGGKNKSGSFMFVNSFVVKGLSTTMSFAIPDTHTVSVRPKNCGQTAPSTSVTFFTRY